MLTEFVYDPNGTSNSSVVNLIRGQLSFIAGQIAHTGDMKVQTPVATMGIRGTVGIVSYGDSLTLTVADEHDGQIHSIEIRDNNGNVIGHATSVGGTWNVTAAGPQQANAREVSREINATQDLQIVQTLLNLQSIGQQIIQQLQHDAQSNGSTGSSSALNYAVEKENNATKVTETVTNTNGTGSDEGTGTGGPGGTEQYIQYIPPSSTNPAPTFDSGPIVVHVATQNTGVRLAPQDPGVALPSTGAPYALAPDVSADGHRVAFVTSATLPSSGGDLSNGNVWLYDQTTGTLTNISDAYHIPNGASTYSTFDGASISLDGNFVVFQGDSSGGSDVYIYDRLTDTVKLLMPGAGNAHVDGSGHFVAMEGHLPTSSSPGLDVLLVAANTGTVTAAPQADNHITFTSDLLAAPGNPTVTLTLAVENGTLAALSANGLTVSGSTVGGHYVLTVTGSLTAINDALRDGFDYAGTGVADTLTLSVEGAAFQAQGLSFHSETFSFDSAGNEVSSAAVVADFSGGSAGVWSPEINSDGHYITFYSAATDVALDGTTISDVYINGQLVHNYENSGNVPQVYVYDQATGHLEVVSVSGADALTPGELGDGASGGDSGNGDSTASLSSDGRYVVYQSAADNLLGPGGDTNNSTDIFVYDTVDHTVERVSVSTGGAIDFAHGNALHNAQGDNSSINTTTTGNQAGQAVAALKDDSYVVIWGSANGAAGAGVYGQRYDGDGHTIGNEFTVGAASAGDHASPSVTALSGGGFVVVWNSTASSSTNIFAQRFDADGNPAGGAIQVDTSHAEQGQNAPVTTALSDGGFVVVWTSNDANGLGIFGQRFDASGTAVGTTEFAVNTTTTGNQTSPVVTALNNGNFAVAWLSGGDIFAQTYDASGVKVGSQLTLNSAATAAQHEAITALSDGSYVVTWTDGTTVFGEHFTASGSASGSQFSVGTTVTGGASSVTALSGGGFLITWAGADTKIHGQQYDATGAPVVGGSQASDSTGNSHPVLATLANGDVVLAWTGSDGSGTGIAGQFFSGAQTQSSADSYRPVISPDGRYIIFASDAALVPGDTNGQTDTYIYDRWTQTVSLVSQTAAGQLGFNIESLGNGVSSGGSISAFGGAALAFNQGTASKAGSVITFANSSLSDFNPDAGTITLTLHVDHGALHAVSSGGLTIDPLQNGSNGTLVVSGSLTDINAALHAGVTYTPASGFASSTDTLTLQAVDTTGDGTTQVVSFDNSHSNSVTNQPDSIITNVDNSFITNVYAVDSSTGGAGAVLDDARALTYLPAQAAGIAHADVDANPLTQTPGFVFAVPGQQGVLQSADFNVFSTGASGQAHIFKLALYEWNGSNAVGPAIFTTGPFNLQDPTNTPITDFPLNGLNIPVDPTKQYVWEIVADGTVTTSTPATLNFAPALTTTGALGFVDSNDTHTVSVASQAGDWGHLTAWVSTDTTGTNQDGTINWAYEVDPKTAAALAIGQTHTDTFAVTLIDSGGNAVSRNVTVTVLGTNELPQLSFGTADSPFAATSGNAVAAQVAGAYTETLDHTNDTTAHSASGSFTFTDFNAATVDATDSHSVTAELASSEWKSAGGAVLSFDTPHNADLLQSVALFAETADTNNPSATFAAWLQSEAANSTPGEVDWHFQLPDNALDFLAAGETLTLVYNVTVTDSHLASDTRQVTVTITGTNDQPVIVAGSTLPTGGVTEDTDVVAGNVSTSGAVAFHDVDLTDTHTATFVLKSTDAAADLPGFAEGTGPGAANIGTFALTPITEGPSDVNLTGSLGWHFTLDDSNPVLQSLAEGETITQVYTVTVTDNHGASVNQDVTVTITGTNDAPVITSDAAAASGAVTEDVNLQDVLDASGTVVGHDVETSGTLGFRDVDLIDTHTASAVFTSSTSSAALPGFVDGTTNIGTFTIDPSVTENNTDTDNTGSLGWHFTLDDSNPVLQSLAEGETITQVYTVTVTDNHGASVNQDVTVTITGTNDAPVITGDATAASGAVTEDVNLQDVLDASGTVVGHDVATSGTLASSDVDLIDTHTASAVFTSSTSSAALPGFVDGTHQYRHLCHRSLRCTENNADTDNTGSLGWELHAGRQQPCAAVAGAKARPSRRSTRSR